MADNTRHRELATRLAGDFARGLLDALPAIVSALHRGHRQAGYKASVTIRVDKGGELEAVLQPTESVPLDPVVHKVQLMHGQLSLFEGAFAPAPPVEQRVGGDRDPEPEPEPEKDPDREGENLEGETPSEILMRMGIGPHTAKQVSIGLEALGLDFETWMGKVVKSQQPLATAIEELLS